MRQFVIMSLFAAGAGAMVGVGVMMVLRVRSGQPLFGTRAKTVAAKPAAPAAPVVTPDGGQTPAADVAPAAAPTEAGAAGAAARSRDAVANPAVAATGTAPELPAAPVVANAPVVGSAPAPQVPPARDFVTEPSSVARPKEREAREGGETAAPAAQLSEKNLVTNASFELPGDEGLAKAWRVFRGGAAAAGAWVRVDASNPHTGEVSLAVRGGEGAIAGAFTTMKIVAGTYSVSFWACADVGKHAIVTAHLAGRDLAERRVGEEWERVVLPAEVDRDSLSASLRVCSSTAGVKVWLDDVELVLVKKKEKEKDKDAPWR